TYVEGHFKFPNGTRLIYSGNGLAAGLGASSVSGQLFFNVNPKELPSGDVKCFYEGLGAFGAGVHLDFWHNGKSIGNGNLYGLGIHVTTPGMTWGEIKLQ
ncbi:MAG: hypothetical protein LIP18_06055, partial [Planctomycetes bacterium]|nr:hypothetical protein [Planctomycetota bacterium]